MSRKLYIRKNKNKVDSIERGRTVVQVSTIGVLTPNFIDVRMNLDMRTLTRTLIFFPMIFKLLRFFLVPIILYSLKTYYYIYMTFNLFVLGRDTFFTVYICFKETLFFNFSYKLFLNIICFYYEIMAKCTCAQL